MTTNKNYLTVPELKEICRKLNLSCDGSKWELVETIVNSTGNQENESSQSDTETTTTPKLNKSTQTTTMGNQPTTTKSWIIFFTIAVIVIACIFYQFFVMERKIEVVIKHPWFGMFKNQ